MWFFCFFFLLVTRCFQRTRDSIGTLVGEMRLLKNAMSLTVSATLTFFFVRKHTVSQECEIQLLNCNSVTKGWCCWMFQSLCSIGACQWLYMKMKDKPTQTGFKNNDKILHHRQCPLLSAWFWAVKKSSDHQNDQVTSCFTASNN